MTNTFDHVAVLGTGVIGSSWASLFLAKGYHVNAYDPAPDSEPATRSYIETAWKQLQELGQVSVDFDPKRLRFFDTPEDTVKGVQFIQENVPEKLPIKTELYSRIETSIAPEAVIATSASGLLIKDLQKGFRNPSRFLLGHPFNPPHLIPLVELLGNDLTDEEAITFAKGFYESCGKVTIRVHKEVPAHVANRLQAAVWREAISLATEGVASVEDIDKAMTAGPGLRWSVMGPHMLFGLGSGGGGMITFCARYGDSFHRWWDSLGSVQLNPETIEILVEGLKSEEKGRNFSDLAQERDRKLIAVLKALDDASE
jgi:carnitine 3-dehydrogenase